MKNKILLLALMLIGSTISIIAQPKTLTEAEFYAGIKNSDDISNLNRRRKMTLNRFDGDKINYSLTVINEYLLPDKERHLKIEEENGKIKREEFIKIGKLIYQKINDGAWRKATKLSEFGLDGFRSRPIINEFTVEEISEDEKSFKIYRNYSTYDIFGNIEPIDNKRFEESKYWIDNKGFTHKIEVINGNPELKTINSKRTHEFEYEPKDLVIKAPKIKSTTKKK